MSNRNWIVVRETQHDIERLWFKRTSAYSDTLLAAILVKLGAILSLTVVVESAGLGFRKDDDAHNARVQTSLRKEGINCDFLGSWIDEIPPHKGVVNLNARSASVDFRLETGRLLYACGRFTQPSLELVISRHSISSVIYGIFCVADRPCDRRLTDHLGVSKSLIGFYQGGETNLGVALARSEAAGVFSSDGHEILWSRHRPDIEAVIVNEISAFAVEQDIRVRTEWVT